MPVSVQGRPVATSTRCRTALSGGIRSAVKILTMTTIILTGRLYTDEAKAKCEAYNIKHFLKKPASFDFIVELFNEVLAKDRNAVDS